MKTPALALVPLLVSGCAVARNFPPGQDPSKSVAAALPVVEATVFKDGHAYLVRETSLSPEAQGRVVLEQLPVPVLGTFWPYAAGGGKLVCAKAGRDEITELQQALDLRQIARANVGKDVVVVDQQKERIEGKLLAVPLRKAEAGATEGELLLVGTATGTRAVQLSLVRDLEIKGEFQSQLAVPRLREQLTLTVEGGGAGAKVGVMYVQRGLRWIPSYRFDIDGAGKAQVQMEASLVNDLIDLEQATVNLVIGVPKFEFQGLVDPISLQQEIAQVAAQTPGTSMSNLLSNSLMTQSALGYEAGGRADAQQPQPAVEGGASNEDLFVFTLKDITLKKGERLVLPIASFELGYRDVYTLDVPFAPPMEIREGLQSNRVLELAQQLAAPKVMHVLRFKNTSAAPLTTAPALVLSKGRVLAQGRLRYAPLGVETDLEINAAIDVCVDSDEHETGRTAEAVKLGGEKYNRIDLAGTIGLRNEKREPVDLEVSRRVLGIVDTVGQDGTKAQLDLVQLWSASDRPGWWAWWSWPYWWFRFNGFGEFKWKVTLAPGANTKLEATWHYFWR